LERTISLPNAHTIVRVQNGDHSAELKKICQALSNASLHAANDIQQQVIRQYLDSFQTGDLEKYRESQRIWVKDKGPRVENIIGFVEPYRDPFGSRAEFEGLVGIADADETKLLTKLVEHSDKFIKRLPWVPEGEDGNGPFEKSLFDPPSLSSIWSR
jgi:dipeptidyl-peptidase-3